MNRSKRFFYTLVITHYPLVTKNHDCKKLSRTYCVAKVNASCQRSLLAGEETPERGTLRVIRPNEKSSRVNSLEHSRRSGKEVNEGISAVSVDSKRLKDGTGDSVAALCGNWVSFRLGHYSNMADSSGSREVAECPHQFSEQIPVKTVDSVYVDS